MRCCPSWPGCLLRVGCESRARAGELPEIVLRSNAISADAGLRSAKGKQRRGPAIGELHCARRAVQTPALARTRVLSPGGGKLPRVVPYRSVSRASYEAADFSRC